MKRMMLIAAVTMALAAPAAQAAKDKEEVVEIGGMSIIGNRELPKSLYIVPWKESDVNSETDLSGDLLNEGVRAVDPEEFRLQVRFFELSKP
jgi:hypothetical protein